MSSIEREEGHAPADREQVAALPAGGAPERTWRPVELIRWTADYLAGRGFDEARLHAELLLADVLACGRLDLYLQFERPLTRAELAGFKERLRRRLRHEPIQYIVGTTDFRELTLAVDPRVLIPRPETELLVGELLAWAAPRPGLEVLEIGTGSGAISLSLRQEGSFGRMVATDISADALEVARANHAARLALAALDFRLGSLFGPVAGERFDLVVSNPPYIAEGERGALAPEVLGWEPSEALFAGADGLEIVRALIERAPRYLRPAGLLALEIGADQGSAVAELVRRNPSYSGFEVKRDLAGRERMLFARIREVDADREDPFP